MRIVYFGCDPFIPCFEQLLCDGHEIVTLFTFHNPHDWYNEKGITRLARENGIPVRYDRISEEEADRLFTDNICDVFLSAEYNWLIPIPNNSIFKGVNIHNMLLPESPGFFPIETQLYLRRSYGGVTLHKLTRVYDEGDVLLSERYNLPPDVGVEDAYVLCAEIAKQAVGTVFSDFNTAWKNAQPQVGRRLTLPVSVRERTIVPGDSRDKALHLWRCFRTYSYVDLNGTTYRILDARPVDGYVSGNRYYSWIDTDTVVLNLKEGAVCLRVEEK